MMTFLKVGISGILLLLPMQAYALVDMQNATFSRTFIDLQYEDKNILERLYSSRSIASGIYGFGWCSDYDAKISLKDGAFTYSKGDCEVEKEFDLTTDSLKTLENLGIKVGDLATILKQEPGRLKDKKLVWTAKETSATQQEANNTSIRLIKTFTFSGSEITSDNNVLSFDFSGRLKRMLNEEIDYTAGEKIDKVRNVKDNTTLTFSYPDPLTMVIIYSKLPKTPITFHFDEKGDLRSVMNAWLKNYLFDYDDLHNLTTAIYPDGTSIVIGYNTVQDWVVAFKDRDQWIEQYNYTVRNEARNRVEAETFSTRDNSKSHSFFVSQYSGPMIDPASKLVALNHMHERWGELQINRTVMYDEMGRVSRIYDNEYSNVPLEQVYFDTTSDTTLPDGSKAWLDDTKLFYDEPVIYIIRFDGEAITISVLAKGESGQSLIQKDIALTPYINSCFGLAEKHKGFYKLINKFTLFKSEKAFLESNLDGYVVDSGWHVDRKYMRYAGKKLEISLGTSEAGNTELLFSGEDIKGKQNLKDVKKNLPKNISKRIEDTQKYIDKGAIAFSLLQKEVSKSPE